MSKRRELIIRQRASLILQQLVEQKESQIDLRFDQILRRSVIALHARLEIVAELLAKLISNDQSVREIDLRQRDNEQSSQCDVEDETRDFRERVDSFLIVLRQVQRHADLTKDDMRHVVHDANMLEESRISHERQQQSQEILLARQRTAKVHSIDDLQSLSRMSRLFLLMKHVSREKVLIETFAIVDVLRVVVEKDHQREARTIHFVANLLRAQLETKINRLIFEQMHREFLHEKSLLVHEKFEQSSHRFREFDVTILQMSRDLVYVSQFHDDSIEVLVDVLVNVFDRFHEFAALHIDVSLISTKQIRIVRHYSLVNHAKLLDRE